ncbi:MAG TPA: hypothetical protein VKB96_00540 [Gammaproteobacteria bacterium]|nr:hypothetical protein [Gammaproteobacteria bacterium]
MDRRASALMLALEMAVVQQVTVQQDIITAVALMMVFAGPAGHFLSAHSMLKMLVLSFLSTAYVNR